MSILISPKLGGSALHIYPPNNGVDALLTSVPANAAFVFVFALHPVDCLLNNGSRVAVSRKFLYAIRHAIYELFRAASGMHDAAQRAYHPAIHIVPWHVRVVW